MIPIEVKKKLNQVGCPACGESRFKLEPVEGNPGEAHFDAICGACGLKVKVVAIPPAVIEGLESMAPPEGRHALEGHCPDCGGVGAAFDFLCHPESGTDYNIVTCKHCGKPYKEAAAS